ncbi:A24 family peptidase [Puniceibacterium sp. IMCC21224]|uniref:prepilin peptidase n=1 Tax=Puniceibacterium sp. IMCC21224 TaxID=1618204 RepID=UPI00064D8C16|nr:A24 family peptidase [Puniceibacterium sp. IMCC21224]KMK64002.1 prepilin signal peptidase PulO-like peptidase [Puniceibacterium sp. IMCC21224]
MSDTAVFAVLLLLLAPVMGSFLGVLIDRLPRGQNVVWPGSACRSCHQRLGPCDLVPILSFALSRGCCRHCGATIPPWLLYIEIATTGATGIAVILGQDMVAMAMIAALLWLLLGLGVADLLWFRLPDVMTGALLALALLWSLRVDGNPGGALIGATLGAGSFAALRLGYRTLRGREGLGLGDVKLMAGLGALLGPWDLPLLVLLAALAALAATLGGALMSGRGRAALRASRPLPFGAALAAAAAGLWLMRLSVVVG